MHSARGLKGQENQSRSRVRYLGSERSRTRNHRPKSLANDANDHSRALLELVLHLTVRIKLSTKRRAEQANSAKGGVLQQNSQKTVHLEKRRREASIIVAPLTVSSSLFVLSWLSVSWLSGNRNVWPLAFTSGDRRPAEAVAASGLEGFIRLDASPGSPDCSARRRLTAEFLGF